MKCRRVRVSTRRSSAHHNMEMSPSDSVKTRQTRRQRNSEVSRLEQLLSKSGYTDFCVIQGHVCAVKQFNYTTALVVGLDDVGYQRRYCFEHKADAQAAIAVWDGLGHPSGPWIKCKGAGVDLLNPEFG